MHETPYLDNIDQENKWQNKVDKLNKVSYLGKILKRNNITIKNDYSEQYIRDLLEKKNLSEKEQTNYKRILRLLDMPDLSEIKNHPVELIVNKVVNAESFNEFDIVRIPEIVSEYETFDLFDFSEDHVARRSSDSYFVNKSERKDESLLLRPHTSVMWYYYLLKWVGKEKLEKEKEVKALSWGKVYRVDDLDKTHHECFHQIDWLRLVSKDKEIVSQETIEIVLVQLIKAIFWEDVQYRINPENYPYTYNSLEIEVMYWWKWLEVVWAGIVNPIVLKNLWLDPEQYNWRAFGFWIERLAMIMKKVPDIRLFWSNDKRITSQWKNLETQYNEVSNMPATYRDISMIVPKGKFIPSEKEMEWGKISKIKIQDESSLFEIASLARDISPELIEEIKIVDVFENDNKLGKDNKSVSIKISFRAIDRTLTNEEINSIYFAIREKIANILWYQLR